MYTAWHFYMKILVPFLFIGRIMAPGRSPSTRLGKSNKAGRSHNSTGSHWNSHRGQRRSHGRSKLWNRLCCKEWKIQDTCVPSSKGVCIRCNSSPRTWIKEGKVFLWVFSLKGCMIDLDITNYGKWQWENSQYEGNALKGT